MGQSTLQAEAKDSPSSGALSRTRWELVEICVRAAQMLNAPRSVGEIFGFLFTQKTPVSFEQVVETLGISAGSASHGLRYLRRLGAVNVVMRARERRDFFQVETSLKKIVSGFLSETGFFYSGRFAQHLDELEMNLGREDEAEARDVLDRLKLLRDWTEQARSALALAMEAIR